VSPLWWPINRLGHEFTARDHSGSKSPSSYPRTVNNATTDFLGRIIDHTAPATGPLSIVLTIRRDGEVARGLATRAAPHWAGPTVETVCCFESNAPVHDHLLGAADGPTGDRGARSVRRRKEGGCGGNQGQSSRPRGEGLCCGSGAEVGPHILLRKRVERANKEKRDRGPAYLVLRPGVSSSMSASTISGRVRGSAPKRS
jgi:hypothetical protein